MENQEKKSNGTTPEFELSNKEKVQEMLAIGIGFLVLFASFLKVLFL